MPLLKSGSLIIALALLVLPSAVSAQTENDAIVQERLKRVERIGDLISRIDENAQRAPAGTAWAFTVQDRSITVVTDPRADRMRIMTAIVPQSALSAEIITRMMQANFDSALDARYAIARDVLWGTFIHPLSSLSDEEFLSGLGQTVNIAKTFGTTFQSGALTYGGGDSAAELGELLEELLEKKNEKPV